MTIYKSKSKVEELRKQYAEEVAKLREMRIKHKALRDAYAEERKYAKNALEDYLLSNPDKEITLQEATAFTGLAPSTARDFLQRESSYSWSLLKREEKTVTRKFVYLDENGNPDMDNICESTKKLVVYSANKNKRGV